MTRTPVAHITSALIVVTLLALASTTVSIIFTLLGAQRTRTVHQKLAQRQTQVDRAGRARVNVDVEEQRARKMVERLRHLKETREDRDYSVVFTRSIAEAAAATENTVMAIQGAPQGPSNEDLITGSRSTAATAGTATGAPASAQRKSSRLHVMEVTLRGTFDSLLRFTENLSRFPHIVSIEELRLQPNGAKTAGQKKQLLMKLRLASAPVRLRRASVPDKDEEGNMLGQRPAAGPS